ncbi:MAG TPA: hypothetical protein VER14_01880 [Phototrophicaceae bacterium]|nr:hypothetical protein [Phototrophicaceae bacterium]
MANDVANNPIRMKILKPLLLKLPFHHRFSIALIYNPTIRIAVKDGVGR